MEALIDPLRGWFLDDDLRGFFQVGISAAIIYLIALWVSRTGKKRFLGRNTVFDVILGFMLGSVMSRAINGDAAIASTALAGFVLIALHWGFGMLSFRMGRFGHLVKGAPEVLVRDGQADEEALRDHHVTRHDLEEAARQSGVASLEDVGLATFERNGKVSIIPKRRAQVVDVQVAEGVQRVVIQVEA